MADCSKKKAAPRASCGTVERRLASCEAGKQPFVGTRFRFPKFVDAYVHDLDIDNITVFVAIDYDSILHFGIDTLFCAQTKSENAGLFIVGYLHHSSQLYFSTFEVSMTVTTTIEFPSCSQIAIRRRGFLNVALKYLFFTMNRLVFLLDISTPSGSCTNARICFCLRFRSRIRRLACAVKMTFIKGSYHPSPRYWPAVPR